MTQDTEARLSFMVFLIVVTLPMWSAFAALFQHTPLLSWMNLTLAAGEGSRAYRRSGGRGKRHRVRNRGRHDSAVRLLRIPMESVALARMREHLLYHLDSALHYFPDQLRRRQEWHMAGAWATG